jgi:hypothetical protein
MIDWLYVGVNGVWILGASIAVAASSYHAWLAVERGGRSHDAIANLWWRAWVSVGASLVGVGSFFGPSAPRWQRAGAGLAVLAAGWVMVTSARAIRRGGRA